MRRILCLATLVLGLAPLAAEDFIPRKQTRVPGPPLAPEAAIDKMQVPDGFTVELVAAEPDIQNPVAMAFDRRGRIWVTESFEYPRREPGPGRDRIKILEDTDQDGRVDQVKVFAEGLNIPSGIALGHGGVWVGNAPDILFLRDTNGDDRADEQRVVVTGFGRTDTHELPNAFTWSPDGDLVGLNGVFNHCKVVQDDRTYEFNCAMWRIQPRSGRFDLFCEGTSNPWGIAHDTLGNAFVSACVIDHLWHLTETGYYHRQGGPYPPYTWKIESIVDHAHQLAAYCGLHYYDSDAFPESYRHRLYMGNIHAGCLNVDRLQRRGSTYLAQGEPDFLSANDVWFMPVSVQTGPDGCLYVLDWYDRFHCYQDANHDPAGVDRGHGRLYRVRYRGTPRAPKFDLDRESSDGLIARLSQENGFFREQARQVLAERADPATREPLQAIVLDTKASQRTRLNALWSLMGTHQPLDAAFHQRLLTDTEAYLRMWGVRAAGNQHHVAPEIASMVEKLADDASPDVQLQVAIAATKLEGFPVTRTLLRIGLTCKEDRLIPHIVWQNLYRRLPAEGDQWMTVLRDGTWTKAPAMRELVTRALQRVLDDPEGTPLAADMLQATFDSGDAPLVVASLGQLEQRSLAGELSGARGEALAQRMGDRLSALRNNGRGPVATAAMRVSALWGNRDAADELWKQVQDKKLPSEVRVGLLKVAARATPAELVKRAESFLMEDASPEWTSGVLQAISAVDDPAVGAAILAVYRRLSPPAQVQAIETLTQRAAWTTDLLGAVKEQRLAKTDVGAAALLRIAARPEPEVRKLLEETYGTVRTERNPARAQVIERFKELAAKKRGDAAKGRQVFARVCGQCHQLHGEGHLVGPDITRNGRGNFEQLLSNMLDPNLVIGQAYQAKTVLTVDGRVLSGLLVEDNEQRVVLNVQGGKRESIPRDQIEEFKESKLSLMPEGLETQINEQELLDLLAYLTIETPPDHPSKVYLPGTPESLHKQ